MPGWRSIASLLPLILKLMLVLQLRGDAVFLMMPTGVRYSNFCSGCRQSHGMLSWQVEELWVFMFFGSPEDLGGVGTSTPPVRDLQTECVVACGARRRCFLRLRVVLVLAQVME